MIDVEHWSEASDGPLSEEGLRRRLEARGYHVTRYVYPPGTYFPPHSHAVDKIDAVLAGRFQLTLQDENVLLTAGDALLVPRGVWHSAEVIGTDSVISLDAIKL
jgi:quercetin dioxygenase-like cupin family protein